MVIYSVDPTHVWNYDSDEMSGSLFLRLPFDSKATFQPHLLGDVMFRGVKVREDKLVVGLEEGNFAGGSARGAPAAPSSCRTQIRC